MNTPPADRKKELRAEIRSRLASLDGNRQKDLSARARELLEGQGIWREAQSILFYAPLRDEVDVLPLIEVALGQNKIPSLPRYVPESDSYVAFQVRNPSLDCAPGKFGIFEPGAACVPQPLNRLDLVLVPGVGFDVSGGRLGRGRGFYDRLLAGVSGVKCGVAFDLQLTEAIPMEPHDVRLDCILTPTRWIEVRRSV
jgi:5-formyltetrahydrofolate cyclo-ligase